MAEEHLQAVLSQRDQVPVEAQVCQPQQLPQVELGARPGPERPQALCEAPTPLGPFLSPPPCTQEARMPSARSPGAACVCPCLL